VIAAAKGVQDDFACAYTPILDRFPWWIYIGRNVYLGEVMQVACGGLKRGSK
jgi:hypothetical protein